MNVATALPFLLLVASSNAFFAENGHTFYDRYMIIGYGKIPVGATRCNERQCCPPFYHCCLLYGAWVNCCIYNSDKSTPPFRC
ncbi:unnamed protein product [Nezara viridula]|uniref:Neuropeptide n=1 Tax=Nezara viridula TaxID=85310 RepID=A0A9P0HNR2_NEZVI|nr:unnamed protein product [Nezara viridula]